MSKKNILVLGSKPGSMLPNIKVEKIYTANGAAEKAQKYLDRCTNLKNRKLKKVKHKQYVFTFLFCNLS